MILDASVAVKLVSAEPGTHEARDICFSQATLIAPDWVLVEIGSALWGKVMRGELLPDDLPHIMQTVPQFFETLEPSLDLLGDSLDLAVRLRHHVYDCLYLALALRADQPMLTADREFVRSAVREGLHQHIELLTWSNG